jgi:hypothetical protein
MHDNGFNRLAIENSVAVSAWRTLLKKRGTVEALNVPKTARTPATNRFSWFCLTKLAVIEFDTVRCKEK